MITLLKKEPELEERVTRLEEVVLELINSNNHNVGAIGAILEAIASLDTSDEQDN